MNSIAHRLSMTLALIAFGVSTTISLSAGVSALGTILRGTFGFVVVGVVARILFGVTGRVIARELAAAEEGPCEEKAEQEA